MKTKSKTKFRSDAWYLPDEPLLGFVQIPQGPFIMGEGEGEHTLDLPMFYIARYPVTIGQFEAFAKESKYRWLPNCLKGEPDHPIVLVTWHDALKYCAWLNDTLKGWEGTPEPLKTLLTTGDEKGNLWKIILPSEAEWEKAARGTDGRKYPWGNEIDPSRANCDETGIGTTSPVGQFPDGASPYGILDMSGNVWEWTRNLWGSNFPYPYNSTDGREDLEALDKFCRVLRGGSFDFAGEDVRCAYRLGGGPYYRDGDFGFRVVASPITSGL